jgi:hypothetical protein
MSLDPDIDQARAVADAVLYEGYLLYPYRSGSAKSQGRWQSGVLGPPGATAAGFGEAPGLRLQVPLRPDPFDRGGDPSFTVRLRFLQLQTRQVEIVAGEAFAPVERLTLDGETWLSGVEATECELSFGPFTADRLDAEQSVEVPAGEEVELLHYGGGAVAGRVVRRREALHALLRVSTTPAGGLIVVTVEVQNTGTPAAGRDDAARRSLTGTHLLLAASGGAFVSVNDPPDDARAAVAGCSQSRCWPVLAGPGDGESDLVLGAPIILYDHPEIAQQSPGDLFDATEIDEILSLRLRR